MKTIFLSALLTACCGLFGNSGFAQSQQSPNQKNEEIIIRKNNNAPQKMTIEIDSNKITVNGKPVSDFNGDVTVMRRNFMDGNRNNFFRMMPGTMNVFNSSNKAFLGVLTAKTDQGAIIKKVVDESAAKKAGLENDDIITKFGKEKITSPDDLRNAVSEYKPGEKVTIDYIRDGKNKSVTTELGKTPGTTMTYNMDSLRNMMNNYDGKGFNFRMPRQYFDFNFNDNQARLGLQIEDTETGNGVKVLDVQQGSAADKAGLQKGDIITEINGEKVQNVNDITSAIRQSENKSDFKIKATRDKNEMNFDVKIPRKLKSIKI